MELRGDSAAEHGRERLGRRARGALDGGGQQCDAELFLGDEEVEDFAQSALVAEAR
jgi:hypothetical protein